MDINEARQLLTKYNNGECTEAEKTFVENSFLAYSEHKIDITDERIEEIGKQIYAELPHHEKTPKNIKLWYTLSAIASIMVLTVAIWTVFSRPNFSEVAVAIKDVSPGTNRATLTITNGQKIELSNAKTGVVITGDNITYNDGTAIQNIAGQNELLTITTPRGGQYQVVLSDGTKVWLNAATTLHFPQSFAGSANRKIEISGEAYLEVAKDKAHPFIVKSKIQEITVLGTHFNISAYEDEASTKSTLLEGAIKINNNTLIKPGEQATNTGISIKVDQIDTDNAIAWKNGEFMFRKEPLESIMRKIARWYDVDVVYMDNQQGEKLFGGTISRFTNVSEVLNMLELTGQVHFKIEGRRIMVLK